MFTGIITALESIVQEKDHNGNRILSIGLPNEWSVEIGESINVNGVCSTVIASTPTSFDVEYMPETLRLTTMGEIATGDLVNLEKSMTLTTLFSGHLVSGHIDTQGRITAIVQDGESYRLTITHDRPQYVIHKGSVTLNGVSLTVIDPTDTTFDVALIPHTWNHTQFSHCVVGSHINIEYDIVGKYIERHTFYGTATSHTTITDPR